MENNISLSPPWETLRSEFAYTIGNNPSITVKPLSLTLNNGVSKVYTLEIISTEDDIAFALRQTIKPAFYFGQITVKTLIRNSNGSIEQILDKNYSSNEVADLFCAFLKNNSLFNRILIKDSTIFVIFNKAIVQFYNDNVYDLYGNYNEIASVVFSKLSINRFKNKYNSPAYFIVNFNTYCDDSRRCKINKNKNCSI